MLLSVLIPVGPRHADHCRVAAASALSQDLPGGVEVILAPDGAAQVPALPGCTVLPSDGLRRGPAYRRNQALALARGVFTLCLDADDYLLPGAALDLVRWYATSSAAYCYGDAWLPRTDGWEYGRVLDYDIHRLKAHNLHPVTGLVPTRLMRLAGGFDDAVDIWEDWTIWLRLAQIGACGERAPIPTFVYRVAEGERMQAHYQSPAGEQARRLVAERYEGSVMGCGCSADPERQVARALLGQVGPIPTMQIADGLLRIEYYGEQRGAVPYRLPSGRTVKLGNNAANRYADVTEEEYGWLLARLEVRTVPRQLPPSEPPAPLEPEIVAAGTLAESAAPKGKRRAA